MKLHLFCLWLMVLIFGFSLFVEAKEPEQQRPIYSVPLILDNSVPTVLVRVNGEKARMVFDTGANRTFVFAESFKFLNAETLASMDSVSTNVFGETNKADLNEIGDVNIKLGDISFISPKSFGTHWKQLGIPIETKPFFDGFLPPPLITASNGKTLQGIIRIDPYSKTLAFFESAKGVVKDGWAKIPLEISNERTFVTKLNIFTSESEETLSLRMALDTGAGDREIILREGLVKFETDLGLESKGAGLGGIHTTQKVLPLKVELGKYRFHTKTVIDKNLPHPDDIDGVIGFGFLKRFVTIINATDGYIAFDPNNADFSDAKPPTKPTRFSGVPTQDWSGFAVIEPRNWSKVGIKAEDIITKIDGRALSGSYMYSGVDTVKETTLVCWRPKDIPKETCARLKPIGN